MGNGLPKTTNTHSRATRVRVALLMVQHLLVEQALRFKSVRFFKAQSSAIKGQGSRMTIQPSSRQRSGLKDHTNPRRRFGAQCVRPVAILAAGKPLPFPS